MECKNNIQELTKYINKIDIKSDIEIPLDKHSRSKKKSKNKNINKVQYEDKIVENKTRILQDEDNNLMDLDDSIHEEIKNENEIRTLKDKNVNIKKAWKTKYIHEIESDNEAIEEEQCSEATYLAQQMASAERLCQKDVTKLYNLCVQLRHEVPPQHKIETRAGSHVPTRKEIEEFKKIVPIKTGQYSLEEDNIIANNWKIFCKIHNWDITKVKPFLQLRIGRLTYMRNTTERRKFVQFLADGLPNRTLYSVYHRFRNLYENNLSRRYKPEEDQMIIDHIEHNPFLNEKRKYADLAKVLRRTRNSIWRRYRLLNKKKQKI